MMRAVVFGFLVDALDFGVALLHVEDRYTLQHLRIGAALILSHGWLSHTFAVMAPNFFLA